MTTRSLLQRIALMLIPGLPITCLAGQPDGPPPHLVLVSVDTLRADAFSPETMPETWQWASERCQVFERAFAHSTWTKPSHATMLSGLQEPEHGVEYGDSMLPAEVPLVQQQLRDLGYRTLAFSNGGYVSKKAGFGRGFDHWFEIQNQPVHDYFDRLFRPFDESLRILSGDTTGPVFAFVHTYFVHEWYLDEELDVRAKAFEQLKDWNQYRVAKGHGLAAPENAAATRPLYAAKVREFDARLAAWLRALADTPLGGDLVVVLTSDHGESLWEEHDGQAQFAHNGPPYPERLRVPLAVCGVGAGSRQDLVGVKDVPSILLGLARGRTLTVPANTSIEAAHVTQDRSAARQLRYRARVDAEGRWSMTATDAVATDGAKPTEIMTPDRVDELKALGYVVDDGS